MRTAHPKLTHKSLLKMECRRLREIIDDRDKAIEELERKLNPVEWELKDKMRQMGKDFERAIYDGTMPGLKDIAEDVPR